MALRQLPAPQFSHPRLL